MRRIFTFILCLSFMNAANLYAKYKDKGASGRLGFIYEDENYNLDNVINTQKKFTQEYELNYDGNIYNPNLLDYRLSGIFRYDNTKQENISNSGRTDAQSEDYRVDLDFIKKSDFPFKIYYSSSDRPTSTIYASTAINLVSQIKNYGLSGLVKLDKFNFDYRASKETTSDEDEKRFLERTTTRYGGSLRYKNKADNVQFSVLHTQTDNNTIALDNAFSNSDEDNSLNLTYSTRLSESLNLSSSLAYSDTTINDGTVQSAGAGLRWKPSIDYDGLIDISFSRVDFYLQDDSNTSNPDTVLDRTDTLDINQNFTYRPIKELSFSQDINYFSYKRTLSSSQTATLNLDATYMYQNQLTSQRLVDFSASLRSVTHKSEDIDYTEGTTENKSDNLYYMQANANISEVLPSINSLLRVRTKYNGSRTSEVDNDEYGVNLSLSSRLGIFTNSFFADYLTSNVVVSTAYGNNINFRTGLGFRGVLSGSVGMNIQETKNEDSSIKSELYKAALNFRYRFFRKLVFSTRASVDKDLGYNTLGYASESKIELKKGLTKISVSYKYDYASLESITGLSKEPKVTYSTRKFLQAKFERKF